MHPLFAKTSFSIDDDILNLIDEVDLERELKEIAEALADTEEFPNYMREKSAKAVSVFLVSWYYLVVIHITNSSKVTNSVSFFVRTIYQKCPYPLRNERWARDGC
jgi:hypothetical protein